jgi:hypothetical protein
VAGSHLGSGPLAVLGLTGLDELVGGGQLGAQLAEVAGVGREMIAGQAPLTELTPMFQQFMAGFRLLALICPRDRIG